MPLRHKLAPCDALAAFLAQGNLPLGKGDNAVPAAELVEDRVAQA